jgi:hypothetical protein
MPGICHPDASFRDTLEFLMRIEATPHFAKLSQRSGLQHGPQFLAWGRPRGLERSESLRQALDSHGTNVRDP